MVDQTDELCRTYDERREVQTAFTSSMAVLCKTILQADGIEIAALESRTKTTESFRDKICRPEKIGKYKNLDDVTDLSGVRLILFLKADCDRAVKLLSDSFLMDVENSSNKADFIDPDRFGYLSSHLILSYNKDRSKLIEFAPFKDLKAEIQIRTVLQHAWSAIDWRLRYKSEVEVPKPLRRKLYRISALLEIADDEFASLDSSATATRLDYSNKMKRGNRDIALDGDSVNAFFKEDAYWAGLVVKLKSNMATLEMIDAGKSPGRTQLLLDLLRQLDVRDIGQFRDILRAVKDQTFEALARVSEKYAALGGKKLSPEALVRMVILLNNRPFAEAVIESVNLVEGLKQSIVEELAT